MAVHSRGGSGLLAIPMSKLVNNPNTKQRQRGQISGIRLCWDRPGAHGGTLGRARGHHPVQRAEQRIEALMSSIGQFFVFSLHTTEFAKLSLVQASGTATFQSDARSSDNGRGRPIGVLVLPSISVGSGRSLTGNPAESRQTVRTRAYVNKAFFLANGVVHRRGTPGTAGFPRRT
jgi:hypothetical protein